MEKSSFYSDKSYRAKQSKLTKANWQKGKFDFLRKKIVRICNYTGCKKPFSTIPSNPQKYCSKSCSVTANNFGRILSVKTKKKISLALIGMKYPNRPKLPRRLIICANPECQKSFKIDPWLHTKYCSNKCAMRVVGGQPTSAKAARGKSGVRPDIDSEVYFYSRWEANYARILNLLGTKWIHQPKTFNLKNQKYTPDFYLPKEKVYIEIKNFLSDYSKKRDEEFRELYPNLKLIMVLKDDYLELQAKYSVLIKEWEFS